MNSSIEHPYQNLSLIDMPGEEWRDVPGFDGEYEVSSLGRIKSLRRWRNAGRNGGYYTKEKIRKQHARPAKNNFLKKNTYCIGITLKSNGKPISTSTARYVYYAFVKHFDMDNEDLVICYKDFDGRNLYYKNLLLRNRSEKAKRPFLAGRAEGHDKEKVYKLSLTGKKIATYNSLSEAAASNKANASAIISCAVGIIYQHKGFRWKYANRSIKVTAKKQAKIPVFNTYLWEKIGKPPTSRVNPIAAINLSPENLKGERWKPIKGLDGNYWISDQGRVKTNSRLKEGNLNVWTKGMMKRLIADGKPDKPTSCLLVQLSKNGKKYQQSVSRLVYSHFIRPIDLSSRDFRIAYKDGKCYNLHWKNLIIAGQAKTGI